VIRIEIDGSESLIRALQAKPEQSRRALVRALFMVGQIVRNKAVNGIRKGPKTGRLYKRGGVKHRASAPGEYPAANLGALMRSVDTEVNELSLHVDVGTALKYGEYLETKDPARGGRPWLSRAFSETREEVAAALIAAIQAVFGADRKVTRL